MKSYLKYVIILIAQLSFGQSLLYVNGNNPDFEGSGGFQNNLSLVSVPTGNFNTGQYAIVADPQMLNPAYFIKSTDHSGSGKMLVVSGQNNDVFWKQNPDIKLQGGVTYKFSYYVKNINQSKENLPTIKFQPQNQCACIPTLVSGSPTVLPDGWNQVVYHFTPSGTGDKFVRLELSTVNAGASGHDFAIDDLFLSETISCDVLLSIVPPANITPANPTVVLNGSNSASGPNIVYQWTASNGGVINSGSTTNTVTVSSPGTYILEVRDNQTGCSATQAVKVYGSEILNPEINILGNSVSISNGDITPSSVDYTEFPTTEIDKISTRTFIVQNLGTADLNLEVISISGANAANFTIISQPSATVLPNQTTKFTVAFSPTQIGVKNATLNVASNDSDENPYNFALQGIGLQKNFNTHFTEDFGSGSDGALSLNVSTEYNLNSGINKCPVSIDNNSGVYMLTTNKGNYAVGNNCAESYNLKNSWYKVADHTKNLDGRFMLIDAGVEPKVFYSRVVDNLVVGKMYLFSSWIANLYNPASYCGGETPISVTFEVFDGNNLIASLNTKDYPDFKSYGQLICPNDDLDNLWQKVSLGFTATSSTLKLVMRNNGEGGCANDLGLDDISLTLDNGLSTADFNGINSISIYPNPTQGKITFTEKVDEVKVFDLSGRLVKTASVNTTEVDLSDLQNGVYIMQVTQGQKTFTTKVVKE